MKLLKLKTTETKHPYKNRIYHSTVGLYQCHCGKTVWIKPAKAKQRKSCGCLFGGFKHGLTKKHPLWNSWCGMRSRCNSPTSPRFHRYGGRGIKVCAAWNNSFVAFYQWGLSHGWKIGLTLERKNNNAGYSPANCCFITRGRQSRNREPNKLNEKLVVEIRARYADGETVTQLAHAYHVTPTTMCKIVHNKYWKG